MIQRIVESMGQAQPRPALRAALQGWLSFMEGVTLDWLRARDLSRETAHELVLRAFLGALAAAHRVDPMVPEALPAATTP